MKLKTIPFSSAYPSDMCIAIAKLTGFARDSTTNTVVIEKNLLIGFGSNSGWIHIKPKNQYGVETVLGVQNIKFIDCLRSDDGSINALSFRHDNTEPYAFCLIIFRNENDTYGCILNQLTSDNEQAIIYEDSTYMFVDVVEALYNSNYLPSFVKHYNPVTGVFAKSLYRLNTNSSNIMPALSKFVTDDKKIVCLSKGTMDKFGFEVKTFDIEEM